MVRIWLNHWFSTAYSIIQLMKENEPDFHIIGSNKVENAVIRCVCDEWYHEPDLRQDAYVDYCVEFCREHHVDLFLPRKELLAISKKRHRFTEIGTKVMVDEYEIIDLLNHKDKAYALFKEKGIGIVPDYEIVTTADDFGKAYQKLADKYRQVCFKFVNDEGGESFRCIDESRRGFSALYHRQSAGMALVDVMDALSEQEAFAPIMVMPYLNGNEISVDCLKTEHGIIMLPREKNDTRIERLHFDPQILSICQDFFDKVGLEHPCNIQFKYLGDVPYFLEVNTRMSGGVQMACLAGGVNIPNLAVNKMLGIHKPWEICRENRLVSFTETPILISR